MLFLLKPSKNRIRELLAKQRNKPFSYPEVGATRGNFPPGYTALRGQAELGNGAEIYSRAQQAIRNWKMFNVPNVMLCEPDAPIAANTVVAVAVRHFGFWSLNFCRIIYVLDETGPLNRWGFAYGTLGAHFEKGEERFVIEWDKASDSVIFEIASFSKPGKLATRLVLPLARRMQKQFLRNSLQAMKDAVQPRTGN